MQEALRLYPAVPAVDRIAPRDMHVGGYFIPKGTIFWIHMYAMQRLASVHEDPDAFRPVSAAVTCVLTAYLCFQFTLFTHGST